MWFSKENIGGNAWKTGLHVFLLVMLLGNVKKGDLAQVDSAALVKDTLKKSSIVKEKINALGDSLTFFKISYVNRIKDDFLRQLIPGASFYRTKVLLNLPSRSYYILEIEFLDTHKHTIATTSIVKNLFRSDELFYSVDSSKILSSVFDSLKKKNALKDTILWMPPKKVVEKTIYVRYVPNSILSPPKNISDSVTNNYDYKNEHAVMKYYYSDGKYFSFQHSSWKREETARIIMDNLKSKGLRAFYYPIEPQKGMGIWYRVRIGPYNSLRELKKKVREIKR